MQVCFNRVEDRLRILVGHQAACNFGMGFLRNDRLVAFTLESAVYAVQLKGRTRSYAFNEGEPFLTIQGIEAEILLQLILVEFLLGKFFAHFRG